MLLERKVFHLSACAAWLSCQWWPLPCWRRLSRAGQSCFPVRTAECCIPDLTVAYSGNSSAANATTGQRSMFAPGGVQDRHTLPAGRALAQQVGALASS